MINAKRIHSKYLECFVPKKLHSKCQKCYAQNMTFQMSRMFETL